MSATNVLASKYGCRLQTVESVKNLVGEGLRSLVRGMLADERSQNTALVEQIADEFLIEYDQHLIATTRFYPGAVDFMNGFAESHKIKMGIVTNKPEKQSRVILKALGFDGGRFFQIFGGDPFDVKKPDPKPL